MPKIADALNKFYKKKQYFFFKKKKRKKKKKTLWDKVEITSLHIVYQGVSSVKYRRFPMSYYNSSRFQTDGEGRYEQMTNHGC